MRLHSGIQTHLVQLLPGYSTVQIRRHPNPLHIRPYDLSYRRLILASHCNRNTQSVDVWVAYIIFLVFLMHVSKLSKIAQNL